MDSIAGQVSKARSAVAFADRSARGKVRVTGADRQTFLHNMLSNAIAALKPGEGCRAELLDERGHIVADLRVYAAADHVLVDTEPGLAELVRGKLEKYVIMDDAVLEDATAALGSFTISGPKAEAILRALGATVLPAPDHAHLRASLGGIDSGLVRSHWTGIGDYDLYVDSSRSAELRGAVERAVVAAGGAVLAPEAFEVLRMEAGIARQGGAELDDVIPMEARLETEAVSFNKGCYLGQEVLARIDSRGHVNKLLVGLILEGSPPAHGAPVHADGKEVGRITSAVHSPTLGKTIALAYVRRDRSEPGMMLAVHGTAATVSSLPFVR